MNADGAGSTSGCITRDLPTQICLNRKRSPIVTCHNINMNYGDQRVLNGINFEVFQGEIVTILGASGVGKTTLLNIISGIQQPTSGKVFFAGGDVTGKPGEIGYMMQRDLLLEHKTVVDNISLPLVIKGMRRKRARQMALESMRSFGLAGESERYPCELSGGMRQKVAFLRTHMVCDKVLLLDEPFNSLDPLTKKDLYEWFLKVVRNMGKTVIFITHDVREAIYLSNKIYVIDSIVRKIKRSFDVNDKSGASERVSEIIESYTM